MKFNPPLTLEERDLMQWLAGLDAHALKMITGPLVDRLSTGKRFKQLAARLDTINHLNETEKGWLAELLLEEIRGIAGHTLLLKKPTYDSLIYRLHKALAEHDHAVEFKNIMPHAEREQEIAKYVWRQTTGDMTAKEVAEHLRDYGFDTSRIAGLGSGSKEQLWNKMFAAYASAQRMMPKKMMDTVKAAAANTKLAKLVVDQVKKIPASVRKDLGLRPFSRAAGNMAKKSPKVAIAVAALAAATWSVNRLARPNVELTYHLLICICWLRRAPAG